jgi:glutathione S-transferase
MKLYYVPRTRSTRPRWMLEELGVPYELIRLDPSKGETRSEEHTERHPLQHVPVLETRDGSIFESAAIVLHLADLYPEKRLLGAPGTQARALAYQWLFFAMTELEPPCLEFMMLKRANKHDEAPGAAVREKFSLAIRPLERRLSSSEHLVGEAFSAADVVVGSVLVWANSMGLVADAPNITGYLDRIKARAGYRAAVKD